MAELYGKQGRNLTVEQLENQMTQIICQATPSDALENMPINAIEEAYQKALKESGFVDIAPNLRCTVTCTFTFPPSRVRCTLNCSFTI